MAWKRDFPGIRIFGTGFARFLSQDSFPHSRRTDMKFETVMLNSLFATCLVICLSTLGAMVL